MTATRSLVLAGLLLGAMPAAADDAGLDWQPLPATESKVRITLPKARDAARYFTAQTANYSATFYIAQVPTSEFRADQIFLLYIEVSPGSFLRTEHDIEDVLDWKQLRASGLVEGERFAAVAGGGRYDIATFTIEGNVECAAFARTWGSHGSMTTGAGSRRVTGYGCEDRGRRLARDRIIEGLEALEFDD
jgi:hypothetical protein